LFDINFVYATHNNWSDQLDHSYNNVIIIILLKYINFSLTCNLTGKDSLSIMLALCSMLSGTYYAQNYTSIIGWCLIMMVPKLSKMTYVCWEACIFGSTISLLQRCKCMDMITTHKIMHGLVCIPCRELFTFSNNITRSNGLKLFKEKANTNIRLHSFLNGIINDWNSLSSQIVNALDMLTLKALLDINWKHWRFLIL